MSDTQVAYTHIFYAIWLTNHETCDCLIAFYGIIFSALENAAYKTIPENVYYGVAASAPLTFFSLSDQFLHENACSYIKENYYAHYYFSLVDGIVGSKCNKDFGCIASRSFAK
jgi:hypothetical protein